MPPRSEYVAHLQRWRAHETLRGARALSSRPRRVRVPRLPRVPLREVTRARHRGNSLRERERNTERERYKEREREVRVIAVVARRSPLVCLLCTLRAHFRYGAKFFSKLVHHRYARVCPCVYILKSCYASLKTTLHPPAADHRPSRALPVRVRAVLRPSNDHRSRVRVFLSLYVYVYVCVCVRALEKRANKRRGKRHAQGTVRVLKLRPSGFPMTRFSTYRVFVVKLGLSTRQSIPWRSTQLGKITAGPFANLLLCARARAETLAPILSPESPMGVNTSDPGSN